MEIGKIDGNVALIGDYTPNLDTLQSTKTPEEISSAKELYHQTRQSLEQVAGSTNPQDKDIEKLLGQFNKLVDAFNVQLRFSVSNSSPTKIHVKIVNVETHEVIREIPPEKFSFVGSQFLDAVGAMIDALA